VLRPLFGFDSVLGACVFALAAVGLGRLLEMRHASLALLAAMLWAAAVNAALSQVGDGSLAGRPIAIVATAGLAVALEFAVLRPRGEESAPATAPAPSAHAPRGRFAGRLA
jgi:branched-subunit amino acid ABC-type transport system permease component